MTNEELVDLIKKDPGNEELITQLYRQVEKLIYMKANRLQKFTKESLDDVISVMHIAFMKAIQGFDPERKVKFTTYLGLIIKQQMSTQIFCKEHAAKRKAVVLSFAETLPNEEALTIEDGLGEADDLSFVNVLHLLELTEEYLKTCNEKAANVIKLHLLIEGICQREIADKLGISRASVFEYIKKYRKFMIDNEKSPLKRSANQSGLLTK